MTHAPLIALIETLSDEERRLILNELLEKLYFDERISLDNYFINKTPYVENNQLVLIDLSGRVQSKVCFDGQPAAVVKVNRCLYKSSTSRTFIILNNNTDKSSEIYSSLNDSHKLNILLI